MLRGLISEPRSALRTSRVFVLLTEFMQVGKQTGGGDEYYCVNVDASKGKVCSSVPD